MYPEEQQSKKKNYSLWIIIPAIGCLLMCLSLPFIGILAAIAIPNFLKARAMGQFSTCESNLKNIATAIEMYKTDYNEEAPPSLQYLYNGQSPYLRKEIVCPACLLPYGYKKEGKFYQIYCGGVNSHSLTKQVDEGHFPAFDPNVGIILHKNDHYSGMQNQ